MPFASARGELRSSALFWMNDFLRVTLEVKSASPGLANEDRKLFPNAVEIRIRALETEPPPPPDASASIAPADHFAQFHRATQESAPGAELMDAFARLYDEVNHEDSNSSSAMTMPNEPRPSGRGSS